MKFFTFLVFKAGRWKMGCWKLLISSVQLGVIIVTFEQSFLHWNNSC